VKMAAIMLKKILEKEQKDDNKQNKQDKQLP